jgi:succinate dehydrogenase/fumarate reductase cytochrome b subunit
VNWDHTEISQKELSMRTNIFKKSTAKLLIAAAVTTSLTIATISSASAQSEVSAAMSMLPIASVVLAGAGASAVGGAVSGIPAALSDTGSVVIVKAIQSTAKGSVYVLERSSDGASTAIEIGGLAIAGASLVVGSAIAITAINVGVILSYHGAALAFVPNDVGRGLFFQQRLTY